MRTSLIISAALLILTIAAGCWTGHAALALSERYVSAAEELRTLTAMGDWTRAADVVSAYIADWEDVVPRLQLLINHEDIDDITLALVRLQASISQQDSADCAAACAELRENARHIYHRDAFTLGNVL